MRVVLPALRDSVRLVHGQPALAMCVLGCFDLVAKRLPEQSRILRDVLPSLIPLLDEKALNARQFDMVAGRVEAMLASAIQARRGELDSPSSVQPRLSAPDPRRRATPSPPAAAPAPVPAAPSPAAASTGAGVAGLQLWCWRHARRPARAHERQPRPGAGRADPEAAQAAGAGAAPPRAARARPAEAAGRRLAAARVQQRRRREAHGAARRGGPRRRRQRPVRLLWRRLRPAFGGASSVDPFAAVGLSSEHPTRAWAARRTRRCGLHGRPAATARRRRPFAGMSAAAPAPASSAFDFMNS